VNHQIDFYTPFHGCVVDYEDLAQSYLNETYPHANVFRTVCPSWDQTARVGPRAFIALNGTPANYEYWLKESIRRTSEEFPGQERFVFINAWNEWAEGCHLEPDRRWQHQFLEATLRVKTNLSEQLKFETRGLPKPVQPVLSVASKLNEVQQRLAAETQHLKAALEQLAEERERMTAVYRDIELKRQEAADLQSELDAARERIAALSGSVSSQQRQIDASREEVSAQKQKVYVLEEQLAGLKRELSAIYGSLAWKITRPLRGKRP
jgi:ATP-dependent Lon protease